MYKDKIVWITGASSGLGEGMAYEFAKQGANLILTSRNTEKLKNVKNKCLELGSPQVLSLYVDLENQQSIDEAVDDVFAQFDSVDILINNAGLSQRSLAVETDFKVIERLMKINFLGTVYLTKRVLPNMIEKRKGQIVVVTSLVGEFGFPMRSAYAASKHALHGFFETLMFEVEPYNIDVSFIVPGRVLTNVSVNALTADGSPYGRIDEGQKRGWTTEKAVKKIMQGLKRRKRKIVVGRFGETIGIFLHNCIYPLYLFIARRSRVT